jgi:hypothetical protein
MAGLAGDPTLASIDKLCNESQQFTRAANDIIREIRVFVDKTEGFREETERATERMQEQTETLVERFGQVVERLDVLIQQFGYSVEVTMALNSNTIQHGAKTAQVYDRLGDVAGRLDRVIATLDLDVGEEPAPVE